jgi:sugar/nucleoside kinase (ribokinase family)
VVVASEEDMKGDKHALDVWVGDVPIVVVTGGRKGARIHVDGRWRCIGAFPQRDVDPTGAGDVFAAAFAAHLQETDDFAAAARFASAAGSLCVGGEGLAGIGGREEIEAVLAGHPEVRLG